MESPHVGKGSLQRPAFGSSLHSKLRGVEAGWCDDANVGDGHTSEPPSAIVGFIGKRKLRGLLTAATASRKPRTEPSLDASPC